MKLSTALIASVAAVDVKTLINQKDDDRKVPDRHPLQRLWRLYQFSEEIIQVRVLVLKLIFTRLLDSFLPIINEGRISRQNQRAHR